MTPARAGEPGSGCVAFVVLTKETFVDAWRQRVQRMRSPDRVYENLERLASPQWMCCTACGLGKSLPSCENCQFALEHIIYLSLTKCCPSKTSVSHGKGPTKKKTFTRNQCGTTVGKKACGRFRVPFC